MVFIRDDGVFDAPIDRIWKYLNDDMGHHRHGAILEQVPIETRGNVVTFRAKTRRGGRTYDEVWRFTMHPPDGFLFEALEGPTKGTVQTHTYIPMGAKTKVVVSGEFKMAGADDATARRQVLEYLEDVFNEDNKNLRDYR